MALLLPSDHFALRDGAALKDVRCEDCGDEYVYVMQRTYTGAAVSITGLLREDAEETARNRADAGITRLLEADCDGVPCPSCGYVQQQMVRKVRREHLGWLSIAALGIVFLGGALLFGSFAARRWTLPEPLRAIVPFGWTVLWCGVGLFPLRRVLAAMRDPNDLEARRDRAAKARERTMSLEEFLRLQSEQPQWDSLLPDDPARVRDV